jgi:hypothetical protein
LLALNLVKPILIPDVKAGCEIDAFSESRGDVLAVDIRMVGGNRVYNAVPVESK